MGITFEIMAMYWRNISFIYLRVFLKYKYFNVGAIHHADIVKIGHGIVNM